MSKKTKDKILAWVTAIIRTLVKEKKTDESHHSNKELSGEQQRMRERYGVLLLTDQMFSADDSEQQQVKPTPRSEPLYLKMLNGHMSNRKVGQTFITTIKTAPPAAKSSKPTTPQPSPKLTDQQEMERLKSIQEEFGITDKLLSENEKDMNPVREIKKLPQNENTEPLEQDTSIPYVEPSYLKRMNSKPLNDKVGQTFITSIKKPQSEARSSKSDIQAVFDPLTEQAIRERMELRNVSREVAINIVSQPM